VSSVKVEENIHRTNVRDVEHPYPYAKPALTGPDAAEGGAELKLRYSNPPVTV